jgi:hypothetical protein
MCASNHAGGGGRVGCGGVGCVNMCFSYFMLFSPYIFIVYSLIPTNVQFIISYLIRAYIDKYILSILMSTI